MKGHAVTPQILFLYVEFLDGGKWKKTFSSLIFWKHGAANKFMGLLIFPIK